MDKVTLIIGIIVIFIVFVYAMNDFGTHAQHIASSAEGFSAQTSVTPLADQFETEARRRMFA